MKLFLVLILFLFIAGCGQVAHEPVCPPCPVASQEGLMRGLAFQPVVLSAETFNWPDKKKYLTMIAKQQVRHNKDERVQNVNFNEFNMLAGQTSSPAALQVFVDKFWLKNKLREL